MEKSLGLHKMPGHVIRRLHQISTQGFQAAAKSAGIDLTPVQYAALEALAANPGSDQASIAALIAYDRATIGGVIDRLATKGLIAREVSKTDRRARVLTLTDQGVALLSRARPVVRELQADILRGLTQDEREMFLALACKAANSGARG